MAERTTATGPAASRAPLPAPTGATPHGAFEQPPRPSGNRSLEPAFEALADDAVKLVSVDIFDTLLWRKVPEPVHAFLLLGERLHAEGRLSDDVGPGQFLKLRIAAEKRARELSSSRGRGVEITLPQIYAELPARIFREGLTVDELAAREFEVEQTLLVPDLDVLELLRAARERGRQLIAVSDTYFSEPDLRRLLARPGLSALSLDGVFASNAHAVGKGEGLFGVILDRLGRKPAETVHIGDNPDSDVAIPRELGIRTVLFERRPAPLPRLIEREDAHLLAGLSTYHGDYGLTSLRAKLLQRAEGAAQPPELRAFWDFGAASLGPVFTGFAEWVHERARRAGCSKVFCLMREGEVLAGLINAAGAYVNSPVVAEPMWLSRQLCARASIYEGSHEEYRALFVRRQLPTLREFCTTLGIAISDVPTLAHRADARIDDAGLGDAVIDELVFDAELRARVLAGSAALRDRIVRYVRQMVPAQERLMLVDLGWAATIQRLLARILREGGLECEVAGAYVVTHEAALEGLLDGLEIHGFIGNGGIPDRAVQTIIRSPEILEQICMPECGSQIDLTEQLEPVLAEQEPMMLQAVQRTAVQKGMLAFQREWGRYVTSVPGALVPLHEGGQERLRAILLRAVAAPSLEEAELFGRWLHDENFGSEGVESIVAGPAAKALSYLDPRALVEIPMTELYWPFGLAALHDEHLAKATEAATSGLVPWEAFSSAVGVGDFEVFVDDGWGFRTRGMARLQPRRNRLGLSFAKATVRGERIRRVRLDPARMPCVIRLDWIRLRCRVHDVADPVTIELERPRDLRALGVGGARWIAPKLLLATGDDPRLVLDLRKRLDGFAYAVDVECAYAALPVPRAGLADRRARVRQRLRRWAKDSPLGAPVRLAFGLLRRIG